MDKATQWKRAAILLSWVDQAFPLIPQQYRDRRAVDALRIACHDAPWNYEWDQVVASVRERSAKAASRQKAG